MYTIQYLEEVTFGEINLTSGALIRKYNRYLGTGQMY